MGKFVGKVIKVHKGILSFPKLDEPEAFEGEGSSGVRSYGATFLLDPDNEQHAAVYAEIESEVERAIEEVWDGKRPAKLKIEFFGEGNDRSNAQTGETYKGYENMQWVTAKCNEDSPPRIKDKKKVDVDDPKRIRKIFYGGVVVSGSFNVYVPDKKWVRICCGLRVIMSHEYGDSFGSGASDKEFDDFDSGDAGDDDDGL